MASVTALMYSLFHYIHLILFTTLSHLKTNHIIFSNSNRYAGIISNRQLHCAIYTIRFQHKINNSISASLSFFICFFFFFCVCTIHLLGKNSHHFFMYVLTRWWLWKDHTLTFMISSLTVPTKTSKIWSWVIQQR